MHRRNFLLAGFSALAAAAARAQSSPATLRIGLTPVFLDDQVAFLNAWRDYLVTRLGRPVKFVQRGSYREIVEALRKRELEFAWICGLPYVQNAADLRLVAVPLFNRRPYYQSYLIVPSADQTSRSILDLRGKVFAFSDPDSNSGHLYPTWLLGTFNDRPEAFFARTFFTWAHRSVVEAVARALADGGAVDSYVWETLAKLQPQLTGRTRVIHRSPEFGHTPFVANAAVARGDFEGFREVLLHMSGDAEGRGLLARLNLDGFATATPKLYEGIARMMIAVRKSGNAAAS
ncbi:MAG: hypothetical protein OHK0026_00670 [Rhodocyclaceae bacterium]